MKYTELEVWKALRVLVNTLYGMTKEFPKDELYGFTNQMRRSAVSIPSNIVEGCGRRTSVDTIQFLQVSKGSLYESETQSYLALDQNHFQIKEYQTLLEQILKCKKLLDGFINYYKNL
ncbi:four helix bundle protein [Aquimarina addita]|uniref:Four helix bundle protein n=1 Tax=Aquimarina addita TaxID=870485 RepID=A0ABP6URD8_9FLAO